MNNIKTQIKLLLWKFKFIKFIDEKTMLFDLIRQPTSKHLTKYDRTDLIKLHHILGQHIRNRYFLWDEKNPYTDTRDSNGVFFPDQVSMRLIENVYDFWKTYQGVVEGLANHESQK